MLKINLLNPKEVYRGLGMSTESWAPIKFIVCQSAQPNSG